MSEETNPEAADAAIQLPSLDEIQRLVGACLQAFASLEFGIVMIYADLMEPAPRVLSVATMDRVRDFRSKIDIIRSVNLLSASGDLQARVDSYLRQADLRREMRNKIAHWHAGLGPGASSAEEVRKMRPMLLPPMTAHKYSEIVWGGGAPITEGDLENFRLECISLSNDIITFTASGILANASRNRSSGP